MKPRKNSQFHSISKENKISEKAIEIMHSCGADLGLGVALRGVLVFLFLAMASEREALQICCQFNKQIMGTKTGGKLAAFELSSEVGCESVT